MVRILLPPAASQERTVLISARPMRPPLLGLINDILDLSKIEAGKMDLYLEDVDLASLIEEVRSIVEPLAAANANRLEISHAATLGLHYTDRTKLKQSLLNLLSNACKFTHQ